MQYAKNIFIVPVLGLLAIALYYSVQFNAFNVTLQGIHDNYQRESESLVLSGIYADKNGIDTKGWRLGYIIPSGADVPDIHFPYKNFDTSAIPSAMFLPYASQFGIQSVIFKTLGDWCGVKSVDGYKIINSILFVLTIFILSMLYAKLFNAFFAIIFCLTLIFSPWIVPIARNLYWVPFTWFLPAVFSALYFLAKDRVLRYFMLLMIFVSFVLKCMAGYEYITSITLLTAAPVFLVGLFNKNQRRYHLNDFLLIFLICILAFIVVLLMHATMRGSGILNGLQNIYEYDVKRRTYGDASHFSNAEIQKSLSVTPWHVLHIYISEWTTDVIKYISGSLFPWLVGLLAVCCIAIRDKKVLVAIIYTLAIPLSWYILAKGHSEVHVFINFVLWYLLFIPLMFYVIAHSLYQLVLKARDKKNLV